MKQGIDGSGDGQEEEQTGAQADMEADGEGERKADAGTPTGGLADSECFKSALRHFSEFTEGTTVHH